MRRLSLPLIILCLSFTVVAQNNCSALITQIHETVNRSCQHTERNQLCYGNNELLVSTHAESDINFSSPGDIIALEEVATIRTGTYAEPDEWGIALIRAQANLPDTLPGQNVTLLLFGAVEMSNANPVSNRVPATTTGSTNIRRGPSTNFAVSGSLSANSQIDIIGQNTAGDWVYFISDDANGWLYASLLNIDGDISSLESLSDDFRAGQYLTPMQAVYLTTGIGTSVCNAVPQDGILIQTPDNDDPIELMINGVEFRIGSTVFLTAHPGGVMTITVLEGSVTVNAMDNILVIPEGAFTTIPLDENGIASGVASSPQAYDIQALENLPLALLPDVIEMASPASNLSISNANACRLSLSQAINVREGPGTGYPVATQFNENSRPRVYSQTTDAGGFVWWKVSNTRNLWIRSDLVTTNEHCAEVPIEENIPEIPTPVPVTSSDTSSSGSGGGSSQTTVYLWSCQYAGGRVSVPSGTPITLEFGIGEWPNPDDVSYIMGVVSHSITVDGIPATFSYNGPVSYHNSGYGYSVYYTFGPLSPGEHFAQGYNSHPGGPVQTNGESGPGEATASCTVVAS